jgi:Uma2 family endonuclease
MTSVASSTRLYTADEFDLLPEPEDGGKMELDDGKVVIEMPVNMRHGRLQGLIFMALQLFVARFDLGIVFVETSYRLRDTPGTTHRVRGPDISWLRADRVPDRSEWDRGAARTIPDLAVEVWSPSNRAGEMQRKVDQYFEAGTPVVWMVRPAQRTVTVLRPGGESKTRGLDGALTSEDAGFPVDGFELSLRDLFEE